jgi:hypothetical protein
MTEQDLQRMERQWLPGNVPPLIAEVRRLQAEVASLEQQVAESSRVPMPWNTPPVDPAQVRQFMDDVWNKKR